MQTTSGERLHSQLTTSENNVFLDSLRPLKLANSEIPAASWHLKTSSVIPITTISKELWQLLRSRDRCLRILETYADQISDPDPPDLEKTPWMVPYLKIVQTLGLRCSYWWHVCRGSLPYLDGPILKHGPCTEKVLQRQVWKTKRENALNLLKSISFNKFNEVHNSQWVCGYTLFSVFVTKRK